MAPPFWGLSTALPVVRRGCVSLQTRTIARYARTVRPNRRSEIAGRIRITFNESRETR